MVMHVAAKMPEKDAIKQESTACFAGEVDANAAKEACRAAANSVVAFAKASPMQYARMFMFLLSVSASNTPTNSSTAV
jgi:hypothetical protein